MPTEYHDEYWVKFKGRVQGPFRLSQLNSGLERGKLSRSHSVSSDKIEWQPLGDLLAAIAAAPPPLVETSPPLEPDGGNDSAPLPQPAIAEPQPQAPEALPPGQDPSMVLQARAGRIMAFILMGGIAMLLSVMLPLGIGKGGDFLWIWNGFGELHRLAQVDVILMLVLGLAMIVLGVATDRMTRAIPIVAIFTAHIVVIALYLMELGKAPMVRAVTNHINELVLLVVVGVLSWGLLFAAARWRTLGATATRRSMVCVAASFFTLACLITLILLTGLLLEKRDADVPGPGVTLPLLLFTGLGTGLAAGITGILLVRPTASITSMRSCATLALLCAGILFSLIGVFVAYGAVQAAESAELHWLFPVFLMLCQRVIFPVLLFLAFATALYELMLSASEIAGKVATPPTD